MSTVATDVRKYHKSAWVAVIAGGAIATLVGLATAESVLFTAINAEARVTVAQAPPLAPSSADIAPGTLAIVPSPVIDPNPVFFGIGGGSASYYAERPRDERQQIGSSRTYESALQDRRALSVDRSAGERLKCRRLN